jgi:hypothetical protein
VSGPVFVFCTLVVISRGSEGVGPRFHVLRSLTRFRLFRERLFPFSSFAPPDSFSSVPRVSGPIFMFCAPEHFFGGAECVVSHFNVLCAWSHFRRYRGRPVPFSCFTLPDMFCAPGIIFGGHEGDMSRFLVLRIDGIEGVESRFHVLRSLTRFRQYRGCQVLFS